MRRGLSLGTLGLLTGLPVPWLAALEAGLVTPPLAHGAALARALGVSLAEAYGLRAEATPRLGPARQQMLREYAGLRLRARRLLLGLSLAACSAKAGLLPEMLHRYEHGQSDMTAEALYRLSGALGLSPDQLFEGVEAGV